uniref:Uncharacterized protein n=1 Tax=uncultured Desulfobacterium sp. TaxID=201089 RepID=E1Y9M9_9BACT|nr:unknown protein [uncultured Desulfobacterium sp.]
MNVIFGHQIEEHRKVCRNIVIEAEKLLTKVMKFNNANKGRINLGSF